MNRNEGLLHLKHLEPPATARLCDNDYQALPALLYHHPRHTLFARLYNITETPAPHDSIPPGDPSRELSPPEKDPNYVSHAYNETACREIFSVSTSDKKYFKIDFHPFSAINPNAIPHPHLANTWIIVAQLKHNFVKEAVWFAELSCAATFSQGGTLSCIDPPLILSIGKTPVG